MWPSSLQYFSLYIFWSVATGHAFVSDSSFLDADAPPGTALGLTGQEQGWSFGCLGRECGAAHTHPSQTHTVTRDPCPGWILTGYCNTVYHAGTLPAWPRRDLRTHKESNSPIISSHPNYGPTAPQLSPQQQQETGLPFLCFSCSPLKCCALSAASEKRRKLSFPDFHLGTKGGYLLNFLSHILSHPPSPSLFTFNWKINK